MLKVQLINEKAGSIMVEFDPEDLDEVQQSIKRSESTDGIMYDISMDLGFIKDGYAFIQSIYENGEGIEEIIIINLFDYNPNTFKWELYNTGKLALKRYKITETKLTTSIEQTGFETKVQNLIETDVDLDTLTSQNGGALPVTPFISLPFHPKPILKEYNAAPDSGNTKSITGFVAPFNVAYPPATHTQANMGDTSGYVVGDVVFFIPNSPYPGGTLVEVEPTYVVFDQPFVGNAYGVTMGNGKFVYFQPTVVNWQFTHTTSESTVYVSGIFYAQIDNSKKFVDELDTTYTTPAGFVEIQDWVMPPGPGTDEKYMTIFENTKSQRNLVWLVDEAGTVDIDIAVKMKPSMWGYNSGGDIDVRDPCESEGVLAATEAFAWFEHRNAADEIINLVQIGHWSTFDLCGGNEHVGGWEKHTFVEDGYPVALGDKIFVYTTYRLYGDWENPNGIGASDGFLQVDCQMELDPAETHIIFKNKTVFPTTAHKAFLIYEAMNKLAQWMTDQTIAFKSDFLGRIDSVHIYPEDGPGSLLAYFNGRGLRHLPNETVFANWRDLFMSLSARHCLGWGIEIDPDTGLQRIRVEPKEFFYNKNLMALEIGCVSDLQKEVAIKYYYNQVEFGYAKLDIKEINGLDEFNTPRRVRTPITQTNSKLDIKSVVKASGYEIESQRRLQTSTKDSKLDDANFFSTLMREGSGFRTKTGADGFPVIENLADPESAYNLDLRPGKSIRAWLKVLASNVVKTINKTLAFTYGEGNYQLVCQGDDDAAPIDEGADIPMADVEPIWDPEIYTFTAPLSRDEMRTARQNKYGFIRFKDTNGNKKDGYILELKHDPNKNIGDFRLLKVHRPLPIE